MLCTRTCECMSYLERLGFWMCECTGMMYIVLIVHSFIHSFIHSLQLACCHLPAMAFLLHHFVFFSFPWPLIVSNESVVLKLKPEDAAGTALTAQNEGCPRYS